MGVDRGRVVSRLLGTFYSREKRTSQRKCLFDFSTSESAAPENAHSPKSEAAVHLHDQDQQYWLRNVKP